MTDPLRPYRRAFRAWRSLRRIAREQERYGERFRRRGLSIPDDAALSAAVARRRPGLSPAPEGGLRTLAIFHDYNWEKSALVPALSKFGPVTLYDWGEHRFDHTDKGWWPTRRDRMNRDLLDFAAAAFREAPVHFVFTYLSGTLVSPETVARLAGLGAPVVNLALNDKEAFVGKIRRGVATGSRDICRHFDLCWTSTADALEKYCVEGALPLYIPEGANPEVHRPYDVPFEFDVCFVGQAYGNRPAVIEALRRAGIRAQAFGPGWPGGPLPTEEMVRTYSRSRINLGFGGVAGHKDTFHLKGRDFEVPMSGGLYVTEHHGELAPFFEIGREIVTYADVEDLVAKVRRLLDDPAEADAIRQAGRRRALAEHTWEKRFEKIFRILGLVRQRGGPVST